MSQKLAEITVSPLVIEQGNVCKPKQHEVKFSKWTSDVITIDYKGDEINLDRGHLLRIIEFLQQSK